DPGELLASTRGSYRHDQSATLCQLFEEGRRHRRAGGGDDDRVERRRLGPPQRTVATHDVHVVVAEVAQAPDSFFGKTAVTFDGPDLARDPAEHGSAVSGAGS